MAAGSSGKASAGALEATLDRKLQSVTNTMESIQSLSGWCIENKKHHVAIVHQWLKWFRKSAFSHRLNLFYLANDIIQNCKRKNAIIYRDTFADVLPEAASLVKDQSVSKSVERVFKIWEDRNVYQEDTIATFRTALSGGWSKRERSKSSRPKPAEKPPEAPPVNPKAALKSKIVAEFRPQSVIDDLLSYKRSVDHVELKEKQLSNMRVDVCSTETLKRLKDKAGGKKFSKDFEEASAKLEEFVNILDKQVKNGPSLTEALENAGIFFEAQYREVKVVVNAYKTFANRVNNLKKKLDQLKATLPDPEESPVPSPTIDAPSPTGSESPFQGMGDESPLSPDAEPVQLDSPEPPKDNRMVEDMELSDVDADEEMPEIIIEERKEHAEPTSTLKDTVISVDSTLPTDATATTSVPAPVASPDPASPPVPVAAPASTIVSAPAPAPPSTVAAAISAPVATNSAKTVTTPVIPPSVPLALPNLANVDLGKISSILSSLTSVMKTGVSPAAKPSPGTPTTPTTTLSGAVKQPNQSTPNPLANLFSKVDITPESILSVLSKTQVPSMPNLQGLSSLIQSVAASSALQSGSATLSTSTAPVNTTVHTVKDRITPTVTPPFMPKSYGYSPTNSNRNISSTSVCKPSIPPNSSVKQTVGFSSQPKMSTEKLNDQPTEIPKPAEESEPSSLEMKIHNFLKGNPGFSGLDLNIPILSGMGSTGVPETSSEFHSGPTSTSLDNVDGTPVRDERSGTPTQDEIMDKQTPSNVDSVSLLSKIISPGSSTPSNSRSPPSNKDNEFQMHLSLPSYRSFGLDGNSPNAYRQSSDTMEKPSLVDSTLEKFFPDTFHEDEDYRDFEYSGPPSSAIGNLEKRTSSFSQPQDFGRQPFPHSVKPPFIPGENSGQLPPASDIYGYNLRGNNLEGSSSSSPPKSEPFYPSDTNLNIALLQSVIPQTQYSDPSHVSQTRHSNFLPKNNHPTRTTSAEQSGSTISASTAMEFKNMLKNASHRPSENQFGQGSVNEDISGLGHTGITSEDRSEEQYRIETRVSSSCGDLPNSTEEKGAPIETLGYHNMGNMRISGEPIKTVESMRVGMKGGRGHGIDGGRSGWFGNTGSSFEDGPPNADEQPSVSGGSSGGAGFKTKYEEHLPRFQNSVSDFRAKNIQSFDHHLPPPPIVSPMDRGVPFQMEQTVPPPCPPPGLPPDHGNLFPNDIPISSRISSVEPPKTLPHVGLPPPSEHGGNPFAVHHATGHGGIPFSPPPHLDMHNPFSQDHGAVHQGVMKEPYTMHPGSTRDHEPLSRDHNSQHNQTLGRVNDPVGHIPRDHHGGFTGPPHHIGPHHRDLMNSGGLRPQRPQFRPREPYHNLKRPRPPFGRGPQFFAPKRPYYQPRY